MRRAASRWHGVRMALLSAAAIACLDDTPSAPRDQRVQLGLAAQIVAPGAYFVEVAVFYERTPERREIFRRDFPIDTGVIALPVVVDLQSCLADPDRVTTTEGTCLLSVVLVLRDSSRVVIDSSGVGEIEATPGGSATTDPIALGIRAARLEIVSGGDQVGVAGEVLILPIDVRAVDELGAPLANRIVTIEVVSGGGAPITSSVRTDLYGVARVSYRLGAEAGPNSFRATSGSVATAIVNAVGINVRSRLSAGAIVTCALDTGGATRCWGSNRYGAVGIPAVAGDTSLPLLLTDAPSFAAISVADANNATTTTTCALTADGVPYCWGMNHEGMLGVAITDQCPAFQQNPVPSCTRRPMPVAGGHRFVSIVAGGGDEIYGVSACGLTSAGEAWCWGHNTNGQLGTGTTLATSSPVRVSGDLRFVQLALGQSSTCGLTPIGEIYCWGNNTNGQLGDGTTAPSLVPIRVASSESFVALDAASRTTCALTVTGQPYCWGLRLGGPSGADSTPVALATSQRFRSISVGMGLVCALTDAGESWCQGAPGTYPGDGTERAAATGLVRVVAPAGVREISSGFHSCLRTATDEVRCWGNNAWGQLGVGNRIDSPVPVLANLMGVPPGTPALISANTLTEASASVGSETGVGGPRPWQTRVRVTDANGIAVPGVPVNFTVTGGGTATAQVVTNAAGIAFSIWRLGPNPGIQTLTATASGISGSVVFTATAVAPGPAASYNTVLSRTQPVGEPLFLPPTGTVRDAAGYVVGGIPVTFTRIAGSGGTIQPALPATLLTNYNGGVGLTSWVVDTIAGIDSVRIDVAGMAEPMYFTAIRTPLGVSLIEFTQQPASAAAGAVITPPIIITLRDRYGNVATTTNFPVTLSIATGTGTLGGTTTVTAASGVATFSDLTLSPAGTYRLRATTGFLTLSAGPFITITP